MFSSMPVHIPLSRVWPCDQALAVCSARLPGRLLRREGGQREAMLSLVLSFPAVAAEQATD